MLVEFVPEIGYSEMDGAIGVLRRAGYAVILAHVERYRCLYSWKNAAKLREKYGCLLYTSGSAPPWSGSPPPGEEIKPSSAVGAWEKDPACKRL